MQTTKNNKKQLMEIKRIDPPGTYSFVWRQAIKLQSDFYIGS